MNRSRPGNRAGIALAAACLVAVACGGSVADDMSTRPDRGTGERPVSGSGGTRPGAPTRAPARSPATTADGGSTDGAAHCAKAATTEACVTCCRLPDAPHYGGFELYAYDICQACPACDGFSPCGTNVTPPAGAACVQCLVGEIAKAGLPVPCEGRPECVAYSECMKTCPLQ